MDAWSILDLGQPYLDIEAIKLEGNQVKLTKGKSVSHIQVNNPSSYEYILGGLEELRDPKSRLWAKVRSESSASDGWLDVANFLDNRSLISDASQSPYTATVAIQNGIEQIKKLAIDAAEDLCSKVRKENHTDLIEVLRIILQESRYLLQAKSMGEVVPKYFGENVTEHSNFFIRLALIELQYFSYSAPISLIAWEIASRHSLDLIHETLPQNHSYELASEWCGGAFSVIDLETHLTVFVEIAKEAVGRHSNYLWTGDLPSLDIPLPGFDFAREAELHLKTVVSKLGSGGFLDNLQKVESKTSPLVLGIYVEQYHVTKRFVEIVAPLLHTRLSEPLRALMFKYFTEEYGHEAFERETCLALGVKELDLDQSLPLPIISAFVDAFTHLAATDPIGFIISVAVTEGVRESELKIGDILRDKIGEFSGFIDVAVKHNELNDDLHHSDIPRIMLQLLDGIHPNTQKRALSNLSFFAELNYRCWESIQQFYGNQAEPVLHGWLSKPFDVRLK